MNDKKLNSDDVAALFFKPERMKENPNFDPSQPYAPSPKWSGWLTEKQTAWLFKVADFERMKANVPPSSYECDGFFTVGGIKYSWTANRFKNRNSNAALFKVSPVRYVDNEVAQAT